MEADGLIDWYACGVCRFTVDTDGDILAIRFFKGSRYHPPPSTHYLLSLLTPDLCLDVAVRARRATRAASMTRTPESYSRPPAALTSPAAQVPNPLLSCAQAGRGGEAIQHWRPPSGLLSAGLCRVVQSELRV